MFVGFPVLVFLIVIAINKIAQNIHAARGARRPKPATRSGWVTIESAELESANANPGTEAGDQTAAGEAARSRATTPANTWVARVPAGDSFTPSQREWLKRAVRNAETVSGLTFSLFVGVSEEDSRAYAERLHRALADPDHSVLVMCDPEFHKLEIVTGVAARRVLR